MLPEKAMKFHPPRYTAIRGKPSSYSYTDEELMGDLRRKMEEVKHPPINPHEDVIDTMARIHFPHKTAKDILEDLYKLKESMEQKKDAVNPDHYKKYTVEVIDMMERIYGTASTASHCELSALKYTLRSGFKDDALQDLKKRDWYLAKASELRDKIGTDKEIIHDNK